jgi:fluoride exporter
MNRIFYLCGFGLVGILSRYYLGVLFQRLQISGFPWATLTINLSGSFLIGVVFVLGVEHAWFSEDVLVGIMVGLLGGYTTFSSYCLESSRLLETGAWPKLAVYFVLSPVLGLTMTLCGLCLTRALLKG